MVEQFIIEWDETGNFMVLLSFKEFINSVIGLFEIVFNFLRKFFLLDC